MRYLYFICCFEAKKKIMKKKYIQKKNNESARYTGTRMGEKENAENKKIYIYIIYDIII